MPRRVLVDETNQSWAVLSGAAALTHFTVLL